MSAAAHPSGHQSWQDHDVLEVVVASVHSSQFYSRVKLWCKCMKCCLITLEAVDGGQDVLEVGVAQVRHHLRVRPGHARRQPAAHRGAIVLTQFIALATTGTA